MSDGAKTVRTRDVWLLLALAVVLVALAPGVRAEEGVEEGTSFLFRVGAGWAPRGSTMLSRRLRGPS